MLRIVPAYHGMEHYIKEARAHPEANLEELWNRHVIDAYWQQWAAGEFNEERIRREMSSPLRDLKGLEKEVQALATGGVENLVEEAYQFIAGQLPYHEEGAAVCILAADPQNQSLLEHNNGVVGACMGANTLLQINPAGTDWQRWVGYVLAHERHHSAWGYHYIFVRGCRQTNLLADLISEGSADAFAHLLFPGLNPEWVNALTPEQEADQWEQMQAHLREPPEDDALHRRFFFGDADLGTPRFTGYTIGFHILQEYLIKHPQEPVAEWLKHDPEKILAESGYQPRR
ncbi:MAG: DUF2268 domain-containing putative Zn-dependent protease [Omnitrophica WOR_2 bacterium]